MKTQFKSSTPSGGLMEYKRLSTLLSNNIYVQQTVLCVNDGRVLACLSGREF